MHRFATDSILLLQGHICWELQWPYSQRFTSYFLLLSVAFFPFLEGKKVTSHYYCSINLHYSIHILNPRATYIVPFNSIIHYFLKSCLHWPNWYLRFCSYQEQSWENVYLSIEGLRHFYNKSIFLFTFAIVNTVSNGLPHLYRPISTRGRVSFTLGINENQTPHVLF